MTDEELLSKAMTNLANKRWAKTSPEARKAVATKGWETRRKNAKASSNNQA